MKPLILSLIASSAVAGALDSTNWFAENTFRNTNFWTNISGEMSFTNTRNMGVIMIKTNFTYLDFKGQIVIPVSSNDFAILTNAYSKNIKTTPIMAFDK